MSKLCGNCGRDHKFVNCPYIEKRVTKKEWFELIKKAESWDNAVINYFPPTEKALKTLREEYTAAIRNILAINEDQTLTNPLYLDDLRKHFKELTGEEFKAIG